LDGYISVKDESSCRNKNGEEP
jgi:hypothetical protein